MRCSTALFACFCAANIFASSGSVPTPAPLPLAPLSFLVGRWEASGAGEPGRSVGEFSFEWAADRHALLRRNEARTPGGTHTDVMMFYSLPDGTIHAVYADNEGHAIGYRATVLDDQRRATFESDGPGPRFRLWYEAKPDGTLASGFEIAQAGSSEFQSYLKGVARRK